MGGRRLTDADKEEIWQLAKQNLTYQAIADRTGHSTRTVSYVLEQKSQAAAGKLATPSLESKAVTSLAKGVGEGVGREIGRAVTGVRGRRGSGSGEPPSWMASPYLLAGVGGVVAYFGLAGWLVIRFGAEVATLATTALGLGMLFSFGPPALRAGVANAWVKVVPGWMQRWFNMALLRFVLAVAVLSAVGYAVYRFTPWSKPSAPRTTVSTFSSGGESEPEAVAPVSQGVPQRIASGPTSKPVSTATPIPTDTPNAAATRTAAAWKAEKASLAATATAQERDYRKSMEGEQPSGKTETTEPTSMPKPRPTLSFNDTNRVEQLFRSGQANIDSQTWDIARKIYKKILSIDPGNEKAIDLLNSIPTPSP